MHLGLFFTRYVSLATWHASGTLRRELELYQALKERGVRTSLFPWVDDKARATPALPYAFDFQAVDRPSLVGRLRLFRPRRWRIRHALRSVDVLKANQFVGGHEAIAMADLGSIPLIGRAGYSAALNAENGNQAPELIRRYADEERALCSAAVAIVVSTRRLREYVVQRYGLRAESIRVIGNFVPDRFFQASPRREQERGAPLRVLTVGRHHPEKRYDLLLDALAQMEDVSWHAIGSGQDLARHQAAARGRRMDARFTASLPNEDMPVAMQQADVFVLCSAYEGHPKALLEAMASGCACIVTNRPGVSDEIDHGRTGIVVEPDADALREALSLLQADASQRQRLGAAAQQHAQSRYTLAAIVDQEIGLYKALGFLPPTSPSPQDRMADGATPAGGARGAGTRGHVDPLA